jgi:hypothetical protein
MKFSFIESMNLFIIRDYKYYKYPIDKFLTCIAYTLIKKI